MNNDLINVVVEHSTNKESYYELVNDNYTEFENDELKNIIKNVFFSDTLIQEEPIYSRNYKKNPQTGKYDFCCLCGKFYFEHDNSRHNFVHAFDEHRCIKCYNFFFNHSHSDNKSHSWVPNKYIA
jgi:hypothetical protein